jgi:hypothetical protein
MSDKKDDLIKGWQLSVVMQLRTPLKWLQRHGEFHEGALPPKEQMPISIACWMPVLYMFRELGSDLDEVPESTMASQIGQVPTDGGEFLPFLLEYRMIVEDGAGSIADLAERFPQYCDLLFPPKKARR